jgi:tetratricopeptide (TPR) repeat protein
MIVFGASIICFGFYLKGFFSYEVLPWFLIVLTLAAGALCLQNGILKNPLKILLQIIIMIVFIVFIKFLAGYFWADILHSRAITYSRAGQAELAIQNYNQVIKYNPTFPMSKYFKSNVHFERWKAGDSAMAEYEFLQLWKMAPNYVQSKYLAGMMYSRLFEESLMIRNQYISENRPDELINKQNEYVTRLFNNAVRCFNESLAIDPIYPLTYYRLSSLYAMVGELATAEKILYAHLQYPDRLQQEPHNIWVENWRERVMPEFAETYFQLGNLYANHESLTAAIEAYQNAVRIFPEHLFARKNLAAVYDKAGNKEAARQQWIEVRRIAPDDVDAAKNLL